MEDSKTLEELFVKEGIITNAEGEPVSVKFIGEPRIIFTVDKNIELKDFYEWAPSDANAFVRGERTNVNKLVSLPAGGEPVYEFHKYQSVLYCKR